MHFEFVASCSYFGHGITRSEFGCLKLWSASSLQLPRSQSRQLDEMSLQSFEIAGGEPAQDEFQSLGIPACQVATCV